MDHGLYISALEHVMILILCSCGCVPLVFINRTRKRFSEKPIVAFTNSTVFIKDLYMTNPVWSHGLALNDLPIHTRLYKIYY